MAYQTTVNTLRDLGDEAFVRRAYTTLLGRNADPMGLKAYVDRLSMGVQRERIWSELSTSDEAQRFAARPPERSSMPSYARTHSNGSLLQLLRFDGADFVRQAYRVILGREADPTGLRDRVRQLEEGGSKSQILADLRCDPEGQAFACSLPGLDEWVRLVQQQVSVRDLLAFQSDLFLIAAYVALFKREPDAGGFGRYGELLRSGVSRTYVLMELHGSPEAREKSSELRGLVEEIAVYKRAQRKSWMGWYCRNVLGAESDLPADQERRAFSYLLSFLVTE